MRLHAFNSAEVQAYPSTPTGTGSGSAVMMGLGASCHITPAVSGRVKFEIIGSVSNTNLATTYIIGRYGTGSAPANSVVPPAGSTPFTLNQPYYGGNSNYQVGSTSAGIVTGLALGTPVWFDVSMSVQSGTATFQIPSCNAFEF